MKIEKSKIGAIFALDTECACLDKAAAAGFSCAQPSAWNLDLNNLGHARLLKKRSAETGVRVSSVWAGVSGPHEWDFTRGPLTLGIVPREYRAQRVKELCAWAEYAAEAGAPAIVTHSGFLPENMTDPEYPEVVETLRVIAERCHALGVGFWFETGQETPIVLLRYIEAIGMPNLGINLDPANLMMYGKGNPTDAVRVFGEFVKALHIKDGDYPTSGMNLGREYKVGEGAVDFPALIAKLFSFGYAGDFIIERETENNEKDIADTVGYLSEIDCR